MSANDVVNARVAKRDPRVSFLMMGILYGKQRADGDEMLMNRESECAVVLDSERVALPAWINR